MAGLLRVYRRFYHISIASDQTSTYTLIDPYSLSATVRNVTQGNTIVESNATITQVSTGFYYADMTSSLYNSNDEYEIDWQVQYNSTAPNRSLYTRFQFPSDSSGNSGDTGVVVVKELDVVMDTQLALEISLDSRSLDYVIEATP